MQINSKMTARKYIAGLLVKNTTFQGYSNKDLVQVAKKAGLKCSAETVRNARKDVGQKLPGRGGVYTAPVALPPLSNTPTYLAENFAGTPANQLTVPQLIEVLRSRAKVVYGERTQVIVKVIPGAIHM